VDEQGVRETASTARERSVPWKPTREQIAAARGATVPDVLAPGLDVLFVGINPGLYSGAVGHHFARPGNRFWKALHASGFTGSVVSPFDEQRLLERGIGITNIVERSTATADELSRDELRAGARALERRVRRAQPRVVAFLGIGAYRAAFDRPKAELGPQDETFGGSRVWVLPNPSGLNASYQVPALAAWFRRLRVAVRDDVD
jgi:TDG/mug DNA glycosylase family protein